MPKQRRASVAHSVRQAKMRKRRQRENLFKREQERVRDAQRYLRSRFRFHPEVDSKEHATEEEAHKSERFDMHDMERLRQRHEPNVSSQRQPHVDNRREEQILKQIVTTSGEIHSSPDPVQVEKDSVDKPRRNIPKPVLDDYITSIDYAIDITVLRESHLNRWKNIRQKKLLESTLSNLVSQGREEDPSSLDEEVEEGARDLLRLPGYNAGLYSPTSKNKPEIKVIKVKASLMKTPIRRKRKKPTSVMPDRIEEDITDSANSHVMTFFDRKVDLAQFPPDHPLYVMCRAWMRNDPSGSEEPERPTSPQVVTTSREIYSLPDPVPLEKDGDGHPIRIDIPKPVLDDYITSTDYDDDVDITLLRTSHLNRWKRVRQNWISSSFKNQQRYAASLNILKEIHY